MKTIAAVLMLGGARAQNAFVANEGSKSVSVLHTSGVIATVGVGSEPFGVVSEL